MPFPQITPLLLPHLSADETRSVALACRSCYETVVNYEAKHFLAAKNICPWSQPFGQSWSELARDLVRPEEFRQIAHLDLNLHLHTPFRPSPLSLLSESANGHFSLVEEEQLIHGELIDVLMPPNARICDSASQNPARVKLENGSTSGTATTVDLTSGTLAAPSPAPTPEPASPKSVFSFFGNGRNWTFTLPSPKRNEYRITARAYTISGCAVLVKSKSKWLLVILDPDMPQTVVSLPIALTAIPAALATSGAHIFIWEPLHTATSNLYVVTKPGTCHFLISLKGTTAFPSPILHNQTLHLVHRNSIVTVDLTGQSKLQKTNLNLQGRLLGNVQCLGDRYHHISYGYKGSIYRVLLDTYSRQYAVVPKREDDGFVTFHDGQWHRYLYTESFWKDLETQTTAPLSPVSMT